MMKNSGINWTDHTANFWWGCQKVSDGCKNCYAETLSKRYGKNIWGPPATTEREYKKAIWKDLLKWDKEAKVDGIRRRVFVSSMSDFLEDHPQVAEWREEAMNLIERLEWLDVLLLTKRPENAYLLGDWNEYGFPPHVWFGTTIENNNQIQRMIDALEVPAKIHFFSVEPMLEKVDMHFPDSKNTERDTWVICGGESGAHCRPFDWDWARDLRDQCKSANVAFWMKQGGGYPNARHELLDLPEDLRIRELPVPAPTSADDAARYYGQADAV
jgi:protein gp37